MQRSTPEPLSTALYIREETIETATRIAKILVRRCERPVYLGCDMKFGSMGRGGDVEEEMEGVRAVVEAVVQKVLEAGMERVDINN